MVLKEVCSFRLHTSTQYLYYNIQCLQENLIALTINKQQKFASSKAGV